MKCFIFALLATSVVAPPPLSIPASVAAEKPHVHYKAFSDSWVVELATQPGLLATDLLFPQLCVSGASCGRLDQPAAVGGCAILTDALWQEGWYNENVAALTPAGVCGALVDEASLPGLQRSVEDVCSEPCAHVIQPLGLEVLGSREARLARFDHDGGNTTHLLARVVAVTVLGHAPEPTLAVSIHTFEMRLGHPGLVATTVGLEHECARRGLRAPPLSTMDLFLNDNGALVCNWNCRPDHVRSQWNLEPLPKNLSAVDPGRHLCWPLPPDFVAVMFSLHVGTSMRAPHASLLPDAFYGSLNDLADIIQTDTFPSGMVLLNVPRSSFDNFKFPALMAAAAAAMGGSYEVLQLEGMLEVASRRLLALGSAQGTLEAEGVAINPRSTLSPAAFVTKTVEGVDLARNRLPPGIADVGSVRVKSLHRINAPPAPNASAPGRNRSHASAVGAELILFLAVIALCFVALLGRKKTWRKREGAWRREDER